MPHLSSPPTSALTPHLSSRLHALDMLVVFVVLFCARADAQKTPFQTPLRWPRTVWAAGMGQQGGAMGEPADAFAYNPALLSGAKDVSVTLFRFPVYNRSGYAPIPIHSLTVAFPLSAEGEAVGIEYINEPRGRYLFIDDDLYLGDEVPEFNSFAAGYSRADDAFARGRVGLADGGQHLADVAGPVDPAFREAFGKELHGCS